MDAPTEPVDKDRDREELRRRGVRIHIYAAVAGVAYALWAMVTWAE